jgi:hypothetical protein
MTDDPQIKLAGQTWTVPPFTLGEQKKVVPLINEIQKEARANGITERWFDLMIDLAVFAASRAQSGITKQEVEALPATRNQILDAFWVIVQQAGMETKPAGEAEGAESPQQNQTGTN